MDIYEFDKYVTNKEGLKEMIDKYGVAIIPNILDEEECDLIVSGLWDYFEHISSKWEKPINRNDKTTWREIYKLYPLHSMLYQHLSTGHCQIAWDIRQKIKIAEIFAHFWNCKIEELLVSFDAFSFHLPPENTNRGWNRGPEHTWLHTDQNYLHNDFCCIQSWITGLDVNEGDATLYFMESSNQYHKDFAIEKGYNNIKKETNKEEYKKLKENWYKLTKEEEKYYLDKGCEYKKIKCPKGSLVFWDSRTIHCGTEPLKTRKTSNMRAIIYLCYMPRNLCDKKNIEKKKKAFEELRTSSHYPCDIKLFGKNPRTYGGDITNIQLITPINKPILTNLGHKLAGF